MIKGYVNSIQSLGTLDGPGVRFVVFLQGCNLRCGCCHNPETWDMNGGKEYTPREIFEKVVRYKEYFGNDGGITFSGGEPLLQAEFVREVFKLCHSEKINTCLDTSGSVLNEKVIELLDETDRVLLDIKYSDDSLYREYVGCGIDVPLRFLSLLNKKGIPVTLRQVIIPTLNDNSRNIDFINNLLLEYSCIDKTELLAFKKICSAKYKNLGIPFRFEHFEQPTNEKLSEIQSKLYK